MKTLLVLSIFFSVIVCNAFPQMIRHGYTSCNTCHYSPRGGGLMTDYGRALSKELLSNWSYEGEENWHYGFINNEKVPSWIKLGGDFRSLQVHSKDDVATIGRFIRMQEQVEAGFSFKNTTVSVTAGSDTLKENRPWYFPAFYMITNLTQELSIRVGRFVPRFGINTPEHIFSTRGPIGFGYQQERDTMELSYITSKWDASFAISKGELKDGSDADAYYGQVNYSFGGKDRWGLSFEKKSADDRATSIGLHGLVGFSEKLYLVTDTVYRRYEDASFNDLNGLYHFVQLGYEIDKGLHIMLLEDLKKKDLNADRTTESMYGIGLTFFPRPHVELQAVWTRRLALARSDNEADYAWFLIHYYL